MKKMMIVLLIMSMGMLFADTIVGKVIDAKSGKPINAVTVKVNGPRLGTFTDEKGGFFLQNLEYGTYEMVFTRIGYQEIRTNYKFKDSKTFILKMTPIAEEISGMQVSATRANDRETPVTFTNISQTEIAKGNFGQEIPMLMTDVPSVYAYSESGGIIGNSQLKVRGFDQKRIGVMINGIPLNDPEDHNVYWVNMPDFAESTTNMQFQRGVGSSLYGVSTFGGSLNMETESVVSEDSNEIFFGYGSYNTYKAGAKIARKFGNYSTNLRFSKVESDGYRDNSASSLWAVYANLSRATEKSLTEFNFYTGKEETHAAWEASSEAELEENHQHNPYTYKNYLDDFSQPHYEFHHSYKLTENSDLKNSLFYIYGKGNYEQYKSGRNLWEHGLVSEDNDEEADIIRQKWVEKNHYGWVGQYNLNHVAGKLTFGSYVSLFDSDHWGEIKEVVDAEELGIDYSSGQKYYNYKGEKSYYTGYVNELFNPMENLSVMLNLYFQKINYKFDQEEAGNYAGSLLNSYEVDYDFFNPRFGVNYNINENMNVYGNISRSHREPTDSELYDTWDGPDDLGVAPLFATADTVFASNGDIERINWSDPYVKEEKLIDYELGFGYASGMWKVKLNGYLMKFEDEIVAYGGANDDGSPIRGNADETIHRGVELSSSVQLPAGFDISGNVSYSENYFEKFEMYDYGEDWSTVIIDFSGNTIAGFPSIMHNWKLNYEQELYNLYAQMQFVGEQYLDNTENDDRTIDAFEVLNLGASLDFSKMISTFDLKLNLSINNVMDKKYETAGYYDPWGGADWSGANYYWPAAERNLMVGLRVGF